MIRIAPHPCPPELTTELEAVLLAEYIADRTKAVWNKRYIREALMLMSNGKCCYCECLINEESKYLEVEHFQAKSLYPDYVVAWHNLLAACKRCNMAKSDHDVVAAPIVHPVNDDPKLHLAYKAGWFKGKTSLGDLTIQVVDLNDLSRQKLVDKRNEIGEWLHDELDRLEDMALDYKNRVNTSEQRKARICHWIKSLMREALPQKEYAASAATSLINAPLYFKIKSILQSCGIWDNEMTYLEAAAQNIALEIF